MTGNGVIAGIWVICLAVVAVCCPGRDCLADGTGVKASSSCSALDVETAAAMLNVQPDALLRTDCPAMVSPDDLKKKTYLNNPVNCGYLVRGRYDRTISYTVYPFRDPAEARHSTSFIARTGGTSDNLNSHWYSLTDSGKNRSFSC